MKMVFSSVYHKMWGQSIIAYRHFLRHSVCEQLPLVSRFSPVEFRDACAKCMECTWNFGYLSIPFKLKRAPRERFFVLLNFCDIFCHSPFNLFLSPSIVVLQYPGNNCVPWVVIPWTFLTFISVLFCYLYVLSREEKSRRALKSELTPNF